MGSRAFKAEVERSRTGRGASLLPLATGQAAGSDNDDGGRNSKTVGSLSRQLKHGTMAWYDVADMPDEVESGGETDLGWPMSRALDGTHSFLMGFYYIIRFAVLLAE
jgi:hypothetical protein